MGESSAPNRQKLFISPQTPTTAHFSLTPGHRPHTNTSRPSKVSAPARPHHQCSVPPPPVANDSCVCMCACDQSNSFSDINIHDPIFAWITCSEHAQSLLSLCPPTARTRPWHPPNGGPCHHSDSAMHCSLYARTVTARTTPKSCA
jgi:hypothetical protein